MPSTTRRTSTKKTTAKIKPTKEKRVRKKRSAPVGSKTVTAALNTYKAVKHKIGLDADGKERRQDRRTTRRTKKADKKAEKAERVADLPVRKRMQVISDDEPIRRITDGSALTEDLKYSINPITRKIDYDSPIDSARLGAIKTSEDLEIYAAPRPKKKDNTLLYILLLLVAAFAVYKMTAKK